MDSSSAEECSRTVVWCCPAEWPAAVEGEGCLNDRVLVEKKAEDDKLRELVAARGWVPHIAAVPARLGVPVTVWAAPESGAGEGEEAEAEGSAPNDHNAAATLLLTDPETGIPAVAIRGMALVSAKSGPLMAQTVRNMLLFMDSLRSQVLGRDSAAGSPPRSQAVETAIAAWPSFVRQVTAHCRATLLLEPQVPSLPQLTSDGALLE
mmetsp:Transcript_17582/g.45012  ORF Transcript_17582/g.45012 Transcript_17582/m.45012 type:complete len:207 (-) Transcript_17582:45-665(-)